MEMAWQRSRFDWLVELGGAAAFGLGCAYAGWKLAPSFAMAPHTATMAAGSTCFALGMLVMRTMPADPAKHVLADFDLEPIEAGELLLDRPGEEPLLLDEPIEEPLLLDTPLEDDVLLLDEALPEADPASRVVQLFALPPMPTPSELRRQIEQHLAGDARSALPDVPSHHPDAAKELFEALDRLRRSLR